MRMSIILQRLTLSILTALSLLAGFAQNKPRTLNFHTSRGLAIKVDSLGVYINNKKVHRFDTEDLIFHSRRNRLIENGGTSFLFLEIDGRPNLNRLVGFRISSGKADSMVDVVSSDIVDMDGDGYLEFGGRDLTEGYPSEDSMYYIPTEYYEIRNGTIRYDSSLTKERDIWINGVYLPHPLDTDHNCCKVILKPGKKHVDSVPLMHPAILSERVDGPANIRATAKGRLLFTLYDNIPVYTMDSSDKWCAMGVFVDLSKEESHKFMIQQDRYLYWKDREIGKTLTKVSIDPIDIIGEGDKAYAILRGYTSVQNIKSQTMPENALYRLIQQGTPLTLVRLHDFLEGFQFIPTQMEGYKTFQLDEFCEPGPAGALRLILAFDHDKLFAIVHHRALGPLPNKPSPLARGYQLTIIGSQPATLVSDFTTKVNTFISHAD